MLFVFVSTHFYSVHEYGYVCVFVLTYFFIYQYVYYDVYSYLYPSAWEVQRVWLGYNYQAGSHTPVVSFDLVVIPQYAPVRLRKIQSFTINY